MFELDDARGVSDEQKKVFSGVNKDLIELSTCLKSVLDQKIAFVAPVKLKIVGVLDLLKRLALESDSPIEFSPKYFDHYSELLNKLRGLDLSCRMPHRAKLALQVSNLRQFATNALKNRKKRKKDVMRVLKSLDSFYEHCQNVEELSYETARAEYEKVLECQSLLMSLFETFNIPSEDVATSFAEIAKTMKECEAGSEVMTHAQEVLNRVRESLEDCYKLKEYLGPRRESPFRKRHVEALTPQQQIERSPRQTVLQSQLLEIVKEKDSEIQTLKIQREAQSPTLLESILFRHEKDLRELAVDAACSSQLKEKCAKLKAKIQQLSHLKEVLNTLRTRGIESPDELISLIDERDALQRRNEEYKERIAKLQQQNTFLKTSVQQSMRSLQSAFRSNIDEIETYLSQL